MSPATALTASPTFGGVTEEQRQQFETEGYFIVENAVDASMLQMLREECAYFMGYTDGSMDQNQESLRGINSRGNRYFINCKYHHSLGDRLKKMLFHPVMAQIAQATLGPEAYLFNEQWVVKASEKGEAFSWHQDSGYVGYPHPAYLTCWCALDDMCVENGTIYVLPYSRTGGKTKLVEHASDPHNNDQIGYHGDDPGMAVIVPAGSIVCFSSLTFHRSGKNQTDQHRRAYVMQYSSEPIVHPEQGKYHLLAVPFIKDGKNIYDAEADTWESAFANSRLRESKK